jgi:hypothetical protein
VHLLVLKSLTPLAAAALRMHRGSTPSFLLHVVSAECSTAILACGLHTVLQRPPDCSLWIRAALKLHYSMLTWGLCVAQALLSV